MPENVDQGIARARLIERVPVRNGFHAVAIEDADRIVAKASVEVPQLSFVGLVDTKLEDCLVAWSAA